MYRNAIKPLSDVILGIIAFLASSPVFILLVILLSFANRGTPFFLQKRPGKNGRIFTLIKFKTMNDRRDAAGNLLPDKDRLTPAGRFIRKTSLDEIPQLINIIRGEMSFIGPRPLLVEYLPLYDEFQSRRHEVKPGITGWAQVNGRNAISWEEKFTFDVWYVDHLSFILDMNILRMTIINVLKGNGISQEGQATMELFTGTKNQKT